jgi:uncharacterized protein YdaU (DUF1376 family)
MTRTSSRSPLWVRIHIGDYRADTADLSTLEHGALLLLRLHYWRQGPVRDDDVTLARVAGLAISDWKAIRPTIARFFEVRGGEWANEQWTSEIADAYAAINRASKAGKTAAAARWGKSDLHTNRTADAMQAGHESHANRTADAYRSQCADDAQVMLTAVIGGTPPKPPARAMEEDGFRDEFAGDALAAEQALGIGGEA